MSKSTYVMGGGGVVRCKRTYKNAHGGGGQRFVILACTS